MIDVSLLWTEEDQERADREGWLLTEVFEIQRLDCEARFLDDASARKHVHDRAAQGSPLHQKAIDLATGVLKAVDAEGLFKRMLQSKRYQLLVNAGRQIARNKAKRLDYALSGDKTTLLVANATDEADYEVLCLGHHWAVIDPCNLAVIKV